MKFDELADRWKKAREQALRSVQTGATPEAEEQLIENVEPARQEDLLRKVFLNSRSLAQSFSKHYQVSFEVDDFQKLLAQAQLPCFYGEWSSRPQAQVLNRPGCAYAKKAKSFTCDYWREALDGLVMGLGEEERVARHGCARHDGGGCVDVIFIETAEPRNSNYQLGPIPQALAGELMELAASFQQNLKTRVEFVGYSAGTLYFHFPEGTACGSGGVYKSALESKIRIKHPDIHLQDISPRAVLGSES